MEKAILSVFFSQIKRLSITRNKLSYEFVWTNKLFRNFIKQIELLQGSYLLIRGREFHTFPFQ